MKTKILLLSAVFFMSIVALKAQTVTGSGTVNNIPKFTSASVIGDSRFWDNGSSIGVTNLMLVNDATSPYSTFLGYQAGNSNTGESNVAIGYRAFYTSSNALADYNSAHGAFALYANTSGASNTATGYAALYANTSGNYNTAFGFRALRYNTSTGSANTAIGSDALYNNTTGTQNTATGYLALYTNTTSSNNTAYGYNSLYYNTGSSNAANGAVALYSNTSGSYNTANGDGALYSNTTASNNTANGRHSLYYNTTGSNNTAIGYQSLYSNTSGTENTANGGGALYSNTTGNYNTANGFGTLYSNTAGSENVANGYKALYSNTTAKSNTAIGYQALYTQSYSNGGTAWDTYNVAVGNGALYANQPTTAGNGLGNTAIGYHALYSNTTGYLNTANGEEALTANNSGQRNTAFGVQALYSNTTGSYNTAIGNWAQYYNTGLSNTLTLGYNAGVSSTNYIRVGNSSIESAAIHVDWTIDSDARIKNNIQQNVPGLNFITLLKPVTYHFDIHAQNDILGIADTANWEGKYDIEAKQFTGLIAQQVDSAAQLLGYDFSGVDRPENSNDIYGLRYSTFVVPLIKAVQEQQKMIDSLIQHQIITDSLLVILQNTQPQGTLNKTIQNNNNELLNSSSIHDIELANNAILYQNTPNPFSEGTTIKYFVPNNADVQIIFFDEFGSQLKIFNIEEKGMGQLNVSASNLAAGMYSYSLIVNGRVVDTKKMIKQ